MNEIKVGEYIRDEEGFFTKIKKLIAVNNKGTIFCDCEDGNLYNKKYITKHSPNIIDLIEVGDYINGEKVIEIKADRDWIDIGEEVLHERDIKSILTKEKFAESEYKVNE